ncbi:MAG: phosphatidylinositol-specific phospholipase C/glycerophosphodiester phosphodiesterase family protein [Polyangiaceae bacterium]
MRWGNPGPTLALAAGLTAGLTALSGCSDAPGETNPPDPPKPVAPETLLPTTCGHAHNDYEHERPLDDALDHRFCSVEADIYLIDGALLVAHAQYQTDPSRSLQSLYLDPLRERVKAGALDHDGGGSLVLLIDIKSDAATTYAALHEVLAGYSELLTRFADGEVYAGPVTAVISGNRDRAAMEAQNERFAALDGRPEDLGTGAPLDLIPLVSQDWKKALSWTGVDAIPADQAQILADFVTSTHDEQRRLRFWGSPDTELTWTTLLDAGQDLINTDDIPGFAAVDQSR